jgi:large subunit ribosomal protein L24
LEKPKFSSRLSEDLTAKYNRKNTRPRVGDSVKVIRGEFRNIEGKVTKVMPREHKLNVEGITREKLAGGSSPVPVDASNVVITSLLLDDKIRKNMLEKQEQEA